MKSAQFQIHAAIEETHWWFRGRRAILKSVAAALVPPSSSAVVVDVGCGTGANIAALASLYRCIGIDTSQEAIASARARFPGVRFVCGRAPHDLGADAERARLFLLMDVLEHVPDDWAFLSHLLAAARPGAYFLITVPADMALWSPHDESFGHYRRYDAARLRALWDGLPVTTRLLSPFNTRLYWVIRAMRALSRRRGRSWGAGATDFAQPPAPLNRALEALFAGEAKQITTALKKGERPAPARTAGSVSLITVLRREPGPLVLRTRPADAPPDPHDAGNADGC